MDFKDALKQLADKADKIKDSLQTEEATKTALIMPFLILLGYDVFNPLEVIPEYICDIGTKKGEKVDYAIFKDGKPIILVEAKQVGADLTLHDNQLLRYYHVSNAKFGLLTDGIIYRFYTDLGKANIMDEKPFLEVNLLDLRGNLVDELKKFHKAYFDLDNILSSANELKYTSELKAILAREFANPSPDFVKLLARQVYSGQIWAKVLDQFTELVRKSVSSYINDVISDRLKSALKTETDEQQAVEVKEDVDTVKATGNTPEITGEEIEAFYIIKSILRSVIPIERVFYRDAMSYFSIIIDDNNRKRVCRLLLNSATNKSIVFTDDDGKDIKYKIESLDEIYNYSDQLQTVAKNYF